MTQICDKEMTHKDVQGWHELEILFEYVAKTFPPQGEEKSVFVEVGTAFGKSAIHMCELIQMWQKEHCIDFYCVDIWPNSRVWTKFRENVENCGVSHLITPIRCDSVLAANQFQDESISFLYIDGDHKYEAVRKDIRAWLPKMKTSTDKNNTQSILAIDDLHMHSVRAAVFDELGKDRVELWGRGGVYRKDRKEKQ